MINISGKWCVMLIVFGSEWNREKREIKFVSKRYLALKTITIKDSSGIISFYGYFCFFRPPFSSLDLIVQLIVFFGREQETQSINQIIKSEGTFSSLNGSRDISSTSWLCVIERETNEYKF